MILGIGTCAVIRNFAICVYKFKLYFIWFYFSFFPREVFNISTFDTKKNGVPWEK